MQTSAKGAETLLYNLKLTNASKAAIVKELAKYCLGWPYVYAAAGELCTPDWRRNRMSYSDTKYANAIRDNCPILSNNANTCDNCKWNGCLCFDCRGFTQWLLKQVDITLAGGGATSQWETASNWVAKGDIKTIPKSLVCCVFKYKEGKMSHTGMHMQDGYIIHCSTIVKEDTLPGTPAWTHWGIPAGLYTNAELKAAGITFNENKNFPTLRKGSTGDVVKKLQLILNEKQSANLTIDGKYGSLTEAAVKRFQKENNLTADGIVGPKTWATLGISPETEGDNVQRTLRKGDTGGSVVKLQDALNQIGHYGLKTDGTFEVNTETAVIDYQLKHNLQANGIVDKLTWKSIEYELKNLPIDDDDDDNRYIQITLPYDVANTFFELLKVALNKS